MGPQPPRQSFHESVVHAVCALLHHADIHTPSFHPAEEVEPVAVPLIDNMYERRSFCNARDGDPIPKDEDSLDVEPSRGYGFASLHVTDIPRVVAAVYLRSRSAP